MRFFLLVFIHSSLLNAKIVNHDAVGSHLRDYSYKDFCLTMNAKSDSLISQTSINEIECFNQKYKILDFCLKKLPLESNFTRGFAVDNEKKVYCEEASSISISLTCNSFKDACRNPKYSCVKLQKIYANRLEISHASKVDEKLNCYFNSKNLDQDLQNL